VSTVCIDYQNHSSGDTVLQHPEDKDTAVLLSALIIEGIIKDTLLSDNNPVTIFHVRPIRRIHWHPVESDEDRAPTRFSDPVNWLHGNCDLDNQNHSEEDCAADNQSGIERDIGIKDSESPKQWDVSAGPNVPGVIQSTRKSRSEVEKVWLMVNTMAT
jgi:hypothetical protein